MSDSSKGRRKRMPGQIIQRGERKFLVRVFLGRDPNTGKRLYENKTIHGRRKDAEEFLIDALRERDVAGTAAHAQRATVDTLLNDLLLDYRINSKSIGWAEIVVETHLRPFFGEMPIAKVGTSTARQYTALRKEKGAANATVNRELALLRRAFNLGRMSTPPKVARVPFIPSLEENNVRKGFFEHEDFLRLRAALPDELKPVLTFAYYTGCRKGEILSLRWSQTDLLERIVRLEPGETKTREARVIPLARQLFESLKMQRLIHDQEFPESPWVFSRGGEPIRDLRTAWAKACRAANLVDAEGSPSRVFHDLRRTGVRNLVRAGVPEAVAMRISGHRTRSVFDRYNIVSEHDLKDAAAKLGAYLAQKTAQPENWHTTGTQKPSRKTLERPAKSAVTH